MTNTSISFAFLKRMRTIPSWPEMAYAFRNRIVPVRTVIEYAKDKVMGNVHATPDEVEIANATLNDSIADAVDNLAKDDLGIPDEVMQLHWANIVLAWCYENRTSYSDFLGVVEGIYSDFNYPYELAPFVRYMPSDLPDLGSRDANEDRMVSSIGDYVKDLMVS